MTEKHHILEVNAAKIRSWFAERGGIAIWRSVNLSNPGASWTTPATTADGGPPSKPTWEADSTPERIITDPADVLVDIPKEVRRFRVAARPSGNGLSLKLTDASTAKVRKAVAKAGEHAWYDFDYYSQEAVIFVPGVTTPLPDWESSRDVPNLPPVSTPDQ